jgi:hypothetical protein
MRSWILLGAVALASPAHADGVFDVCKGESRTAVAGTGQLSIAVVYPDDFPVVTTPQSRNAVGESIARAEKARIVPAKDVEAAKQLVGDKKWNEHSPACGYAPSLVAVLGQKHPNLSTARASVACDDKTACELRIDVERHGKPTAERFVRYAAALAGPKDKLPTIIAAAGKLVTRGAPPDAPRAGLAVHELPSGVVTIRSNVDGALEIDRAMEANPALAACGPKGRKGHDIRGYWADWKLSALGTAMEVTVRPFGGADPADRKATECLEAAMQRMQVACPRDGKVTPVRSAICL